MPKRTFHGKDVILRIGATNNELGASKGLSLDVSADTLDTTTRSDASHGFTTHMQSWKTWSVSTDGLYVANEIAKDTIGDYFDSGDEMPIMIELPDGTTYSGRTIVTSFPIDLPYDESVTFAAEFQGTGELERSGRLSGAKGSIKDGLNQLTKGAKKDA